MSLFLRDEYEELSLREKDAVRALKSALVGVLIAPLQLYTLFLILMVILAEEPLRPTTSGTRWQYRLSSHCIFHLSR